MPPLFFASAKKAAILSSGSVFISTCSPFGSLQPFAGLYGISFSAAALSSAVEIKMCTLRTVFGLSPFGCFSDFHIAIPIRLRYTLTNRADSFCTLIALPIIQKKEMAL